MSIDRGKGYMSSVFPLHFPTIGSRLLPVVSPGRSDFGISRGPSVARHFARLIESRRQGVVVSKNYIQPAEIVKRTLRQVDPPIAIMSIQRRLGGAHYLAFECSGLTKDDYGTY